MRTLSCIGFAALIVWFISAIITPTTDNYREWANNNLNQAERREYSDQQNREIYREDNKRGGERVNRMQCIFNEDDEN